MPPRSLSDEMSDPWPACRAGAKPVRTPVATLTKERKKQQARIDCGLQGVSRGVTRQECDESPHGERGQHHPERSASQRDKKTVGKKLPSDSPARSA